MDLWVRSQNRERLGIIQYIEYAKDDYGHYLIGWSDKFEGTKVATYKTKERALEVLDEIQRIIKPRIIFQEIKTERKLDNNLGDYDLSDAVLHTYQSPVVKELGTYVYEMPEE